MMLWPSEKFSFLIFVIAVTLVEIMGVLSSSSSLQDNLAGASIKELRVKRETISEMINRKKIAGKLPVLKPIVIPTLKPLKHLPKTQIKSKMANIPQQGRWKSLQKQIQDFKARMSIKPLNFKARSTFDKKTLAEKIKILQEDLKKKIPMKNRFGGDLVGSPLTLSPNNRFGVDEKTKKKTTVNENIKEGEEDKVKAKEPKKYYKSLPTNVSAIPVVVLGPITTSTISSLKNSISNTESDNPKLYTRSTTFEKIKEKQKDAMSKIRSKLMTNKDSSNNNQDIYL